MGNGAFLILYLVGNLWSIQKEYNFSRNCRCTPQCVVVMSFSYWGASVLGSRNDRHVVYQWKMYYLSWIIYWCFYGAFFKKSIFQEIVGVHHSVWWRPHSRVEEHRYWEAETRNVQFINRKWWIFQEIYIGVFKEEMDFSRNPGIQCSGESVERVWRESGGESGERVVESVECGDVILIFMFGRIGIGM